MQKMSLLDYPGRVSAVVFTSGCNFRCPFCHNPELVMPLSEYKKENFPLASPYKGGKESEINQSSEESKEQSSDENNGEKEFFEFLKGRKNFLDGVCVTGGEPLLQPDMEDFIKRIRGMGFSIKLDTNGLLFEKLKNIVEKGLIDFVAMDIKSSMDKYNLATGVHVDMEQIKNSINFIMQSGIDYEFRTTVLANLHKKEDIVNIAKFIKGAKNYALQKFEVRDKILDKSFKNASSITKTEAEVWKKECERYVEKCALKGWQG